MRKHKFAALILSLALLCGCADITENESEPQYSPSSVTQSHTDDTSSFDESSPADSTQSSSTSSETRSEMSSSSSSSSSEASSSDNSSEPGTASISPSSSENIPVESSSGISSSAPVSSSSASSAVSSVVSNPESSSSAVSKPPVNSAVSSSSSKPPESSAVVVSSSKKEDQPVVPANNKSILDDYKSKYFYSTLNDQQKTVYERLFKAAENFEDSVDISGLGLERDQLQQAFYSMKYENPQFFYIENGFGYSNSSASLYYGMSREEALEMKPKLEAAAMNIVNKAMAKSSVKERAKVIHDEICKMTDYQLTYSEPYGPLLYGEALCEGYGKAFAYVAQMAGIETVSITGFAARGGHLWNMIKLGNEWVHVDVTFDDQKSGTIYEYFCVGDDYIGYDHVPDDEYTNAPSTLAAAYDEEKVKAEFDKFIAQIKANYDKGVMVTTYYPDYKPMGGLLKYTVYNMNYGVYEAGITDKRPMYMYYNNWIEIQLA